MGDSTPRTRARYGYGASYEWLKGRLEYLASSDQWKIRYIPIDGVTDDFGGSVRIANPAVLADLAAGDFVEVRGRLEEDGLSGESFAPSYRLARVRPLAD